MSLLKLTDLNVNDCIAFFKIIEEYQYFLVILVLIFLATILQYTVFFLLYIFFFAKPEAVFYVCFLVNFIQI